MQIQYFSTTTCNSNQKWNNETCHWECKNYHTWKKAVAGILAKVLVRIVSI